MDKSETITPEIFAALVQKLIWAYSTEEWSYNVDNFSLNSTSSDKKSLSMHRLYQHYSAGPSPANLLELQRQLRVLLTPTPMSSKEDLLSMLRPKLMTYVAYQSQNLYAIEKGHAGKTDTTTGELVFFPYAGVLAIGLDFDKGEKVQWVTDVEIEQLGIGIEEAVDIAVSNLRQISTEPFRQVQPGFYTSPWKDLYDGARLLLPDLFANLKVDGEIIALTPSADMLFVTGSRDRLGLELMTKLGAAIMQDPQSVAALPLVLRDGIWQPYVVPYEDRTFDTVNSYRVNVLKLLYKAQDNLLSQSNVDRQSVFVSPFTVDTDKEDGYFFSRTSVLEGSTNMIPECDIVEFFTRAGANKVCVARAPFNNVVEALPHLIARDPILTPGRWRLNDFPSQEELAALGMMPPETGVYQQLENPALAHEDLEEIMSTPIPPGAAITHTSEGENGELIMEFVIRNCSVDYLKDFYLKRLKIGSMIMIDTEQGDFMIAEALSAACVREAWFGPSKVKGETLLRLKKRVNLDAPAVHNALIKQSENLRSFEQLFGISLLADMVPDGALKTSQESVSQMFLSPTSPDAVAKFFRVQLSGPKTVYMPPEQSPHLIMNNETEVTVTIMADKQPEGTMLSVSRSLKS